MVPMLFVMVSGKLPPRKFPPEFPPPPSPPVFLNIPTRVFKFLVFLLLSVSSLILLKILFSNSMFSKVSAEVRNSEVDESKKL